MFSAECERSSQWFFGCLCRASVSHPGIQLFREIAFLDKEVEFQPEAVKLKGVYVHVGERLWF